MFDILQLKPDDNVATNIETATKQKHGLCRYKPTTETWTK